MSLSSETAWVVWAPVVGTLGGTVLGGLIGFVSSLTLAARGDRTARRNLLIARLEELHQAAGKVRRVMGKAHVSAMAWIENGKPFEKPEPPPHDRLETLVHMYTPELDGEYEKVKEIGRRHNLLFLEALGERPEDPAARDALMKRLNELARSLDSSYAELQAGAARAARKRLAD